MQILSDAFWLVALFWGCTVVVSGQEPANQLPEYRVAVVRDDHSWYFDQTVAAFSDELAKLAQGNYQIVVDHRANAEGDLQRVPDLVRQVLDDPTVDVVYAGGVVAAEVAASLPSSERLKPVIGGALQMVDIKWVPISEEGTSEVPRYTFITNPQRVRSDLKLLQRLVDPSVVHILIDRPIIEWLRILENGVQHFETELGMDLVVIGSELTAAATLDRVPADAKAVYVPLQSRMPKKERIALYRGLADRGIVVVAMGGRPEVDLGALAGLEPDTLAQVARRIALNIHQLLQGVGTELLPVYLPVQDRLVVNMEAAKRAGWSPDYDLSLIAEFLNPDAVRDRKPLTLVEAMQRARDANVEVQIAAEEPEIRRQEALITRGNLLPNLDLVGRYGGTRYSDIINPMLTPEYARQGSLGLQLRQLLYSDPVLSGWRAQKQSVVASEFQLLSEELDAVMSAVSAYLDVLSARALRKIERENLALTENNLSLAQLRLDIGVAEPSEIHRWERDQARNRAALIQRDYQLDNAMVVLNQVMGTDRQQAWELADIPLENERDLFFFGERLLEIVRNLDEFTRFGDFLRIYAVLASPELASFDYGLIGQGILFRQKKRRFYVPEVALSVRGDRIASRSSFQRTDGQNEATLGVELSFPLFAGGARRAEVKKQAATIRQLSQQREQALQQIEGAALIAKNNVGALHPNIRLNRLSLNAAERLYESMLQKYSLGAVDYLNLLDAQQALLVQRQQAALAVYQYLLAIHQLQRAVAWFEYDKSDSEREAWLSLLTQFLSTGELADPAAASLGSGREVRGAAAAVVTRAQKR